MRTVWVLGDQLNRRIGALADADPGSIRVLLVESEAKLSSKRFHRQRLHLVLTAMRRFALELERAGFEVDLRRSSTLARGLAEHRAEHHPSDVVATEPSSVASRRLLTSLGVELVRSNQFLCHDEEFAAWAGEQRGRSTMESFYRWRRRATGYLMDGDEPAGGTWNLDAENREPPPRGLTDRQAAVLWPPPPRSRLDEVDREVLASLPSTAFGADPDGTWPTSRRAALARLRHVIEVALPRSEDGAIGSGSRSAHRPPRSPRPGGGRPRWPGRRQDLIQGTRWIGPAPNRGTERAARQGATGSTTASAATRTSTR